ncbi:hypothetical protein THAOC_29508 [Thalassiosira oceanica]|uniref:Uncharacterized protein n=2 Tax=Thalassiosira oceanica TaxID=159749 RepID=K0RC80_THAOC|nr:hypothetical protein THAOC_29508 [Thalassiosira oceanica]|eukprot:EJK51328.1 hypothetical protein THAOC_29508 [Thalassiosira oceanica]
MIAICRLLPTDARLAEDGIIYCCACIEEHFKVAAPGKAQSPLKGLTIGTTLLRPIAVINTINELVRDHKDDLDPIYYEKQKPASSKNVDELNGQALAFMFGLDGKQIDLGEAYKKSEQSANCGSMLGKAYQGYCTLHDTVSGGGPDWETGFLLLTEAAKQSVDCRAREFAADALAHCYQNGAHGFKKNDRKAQRWRSMVQSDYHESPFGLS